MEKKIFRRGNINRTSTKIEINESKIIGYGNTVYYIFDMIKRSDKNCRVFCVMGNHSKESLLPIIKNNAATVMDINNNMFSMHTKSVLSEKSKTFNLSTPYLLFKSINLSCTEQINNNIYPNLESLNVYDNEDRQYKILEKGLSIINDTFSNEYSVYFLNSSIIDTNIFYDNLVNNLENSIKYYIVCMAFAMVDSVQKNLNVKRPDNGTTWYP